MTAALSRWLRRSSLARRAAPLAVVITLGVAGGAVVARAVDADRHQAAQRRADLTAQQVRAALDRARTFAIGFASALANEPVPDGRRFAALESSATAAVGLTTALWVEEIEARRRRAYERRIGGPIRALSGQPLPRSSRVHLPATFLTSAELRRGTDVSEVGPLSATLRDPTSVFAGTATSIGAFGGRPGFFLVQGARFGRGPGSTGFLVMFVPAGWLGLLLADDVGRIAISLDGRRLEGGLATAPAAGVGFEAFTRRWRVDVDAEPATALQTALPWLALLWPLGTALIVYLIGHAILRRRRAERVVDDIFDLSLDALCVLGLDGRFERVNPASERMLGYPAHELVARPMVDFVHPDDREPTQAAIAALATGVQQHHLVTRFLRADGVIRWLQWSARALLDRGLIYGAARDVTDNRLLTEEQAALRRVATLAAEGQAPDELFEAVAVEVGRLLDADRTRLLRYEDDGTAAVVAGHGPSDPALDVGARVSGDARQRLVEAGAGATVAASIVVSGRPWGLIVAAFKSPDAVRPDTESRMAQFTELVATAVANAQSSAELTASRRRIVETADETRRRIERDLHDGAQQRLVHTIVTLKLARSKLGDNGGAAAELVGEGLDQAEEAIAEIRELARGIHPAVLSDRGLVEALRMLAQRSPVPVTLDARLERRPPAPTEVTAYYVVAEALTNVAKHAHASRVQLTLEDRDGELRVCIADDGAGGADPSRGSGLLGLTDRVEAAGGTLTVESRPGAGTRLDIALPTRTAEPAVTD